MCMCNTSLQDVQATSSRAAPSVRFSQSEKDVLERLLHVCQHEKVSADLLHALMLPVRSCDSTCACSLLPNLAKAGTMRAPVSSGNKAGAAAHLPALLVECQ